MGGLKSLTFPTIAIETPGGMFAVRGLSLSDISSLAVRNRETLKALFEKATQSDGAVELDNMEAIAVSLAQTAPGIVAEVIALATDEFDDEAIEAAKGLPFPAQVEALEAIGKLTFTTEGGLKKVVATIINVTKGTTTAIGSLQTSTSGFGA